jgi:hypothetical protein
MSSVEFVAHLRNGEKLPRTLPHRNLGCSAPARRFSSYTRARMLSTTMDELHATIGNFVESLRSR